MTMRSPSYSEQGLSDLCIILVHLFVRSIAVPMAHLKRIGLKEPMSCRRTRPNGKAQPCMDFRRLRSRRMIENIHMRMVWIWIWLRSCYQSNERARKVRMCVWPDGDRAQKKTQKIINQNSSKFSGPYAAFIGKSSAMKYRPKAVQFMLARSCVSAKIHSKM